MLRTRESSTDMFILVAPEAECLGDGHGHVSYVYSPYWQWVCTRGLDEGYEQI